MSERTTSSEVEQRAVALLKRCNMAVASWDKRFVRALPEDSLTVKERPQVWRLVIRYRRQIQGMMVTSLKRGERQEQIGQFQTLLHHAAMLAAPDLRQVNAANAKRAVEEKKLRRAMNHQDTKAQS